MPRYNTTLQDVVRRDRIAGIFKTDLDTFERFQHEEPVFRASKTYRALTGAFESDVSDEEAYSESSESSSTSASTSSHSVILETEEEIEKVLDEFIATYQDSDIYVSFTKEHLQKEVHESVKKKSDPRKRARRVTPEYLLKAMLQVKHGDEVPLKVDVKD